LFVERGVSGSKPLPSMRSTCGKPKARGVSLHHD
jgi:hypothetical protein